MSKHEYDKSREVAAVDAPFNALIMAAMRQADSTNAGILQAIYPAVWDELQARYNAPGGILDTDPQPRHQ